VKAIRVREFGGPEQLKLEEVPDLRPAAGQIVVRIRAVGVNPVDAYIRQGAYAVKPNLPYTPGMDGSGEVIGVGEGVTGRAVGDRVYVAGSLSGTYAEQTLCAEGQVHPLPARASFAQGAAMGVPYATAYRALFHKARIQPGETLLVHGATGGVGTAAVQLARAQGATVIATGGTPEGRALLLKEGAHHVSDHHAPDMAEHLAKITNGRGVDVILEMLANQNLGKDLRMLAKLGRVVVVGSRGPVEINARDLMGRDGQIIAMTLFNVPPDDLARIHAALVAGLENGTLQPIIGRQLPLAQAARAHEEVMKPSGAHGKMVLLA